MKDELDDLKSMWQQAKESGQQQKVMDVNALITLGEAKKKSMLAAHYGNALVLSATVIMLIFYFYYLYNFQMTLSHIGYNLMIGGLIVRIGIEIFSVFRSKQISISDTAIHSLENSIAFYQFRRRIHGPVTIFIFTLYFVGFYMLTPEFSKYISLKGVILMDISALVVAAVLILFIRRGILQELRDLEKIVELQKSLTKDKVN
jgi:hypothetical protein